MSSGVEFEEDVNVYAHRAPGTPAPQQGVPQFNSTGRYVPPAAKEPPMVQWLMKHGIKSPLVAQAILIGIVVINIVVTYIVIRYLL